MESAVYFVRSGILEITLKSNETEKILDFFFAGDMLTALTSFLQQQPSDVEIVALTDCELEKITHTDLQKAYVHSADANTFGRLMIEQAYLKKAKREKDLLAKTAEERYAEMLHTHKQYITEIPVNKIARYLGIQPESLSRIRRKLIS